MWANYQQISAGAPRTASTLPSQCPGYTGQHRGPRRPDRHGLLRKATPKPDQLLVGALEKVLERISRLLQQEEKKRQKAGAQPSEPLPKKKISFDAHARGRKDVQEPTGGPVAGRGLQDYISLPITEYSLLDPRWITRPSGEEDLFLLSVPLQDLASINLNPQVYIRVDVDMEQKRVHFNADRFSVGDPRWDEGFNLGMTASLQYHPPGRRAFPLLGSLLGQQHNSPAPAQQPSSSSNSNDSSSSGMGSSQGAALEQGPGEERAQEAGAQGLSSTASVGNPQGTSTSSSTQLVATHTHTDSMSNSSSGGPPNSTSGRSHGTGSNSIASGLLSDTAAPLAGKLDLDVKLSCSLLVPHPLAAVPGPMLSLAGGLIARLLIQSLIPSFLDLLKVDYQRWATGQGSRKEAAGSLVTKASSLPSTSTIDLSIDTEEEEVEKEAATVAAAQTAQSGNSAQPQLEPGSEAALQTSQGTSSTSSQAPLSTILDPHRSCSNGHVKADTTDKNVNPAVAAEGADSDPTTAKC